MAQNPVVAMIVQAARARGVDPAAALAVASREGLSGRIGDGGHAYGPFQLNNAGGVITGSHPGVNDPATQAWASSQAGINFALDRIAGVAHGLRGRQAIDAIVSRFERPRDIPGEIAGAVGAYGQYGNLGSGGGPSSLSPAAAVTPRQAVPQLGLMSPLVQQIVASNDQILGVPAPRFDLLSPRQPAVGANSAPSQPQAPYKNTAPRVNGRTLKFIESYGAPFGLTITSTTGGTHAKGSYHYQGRAVDFGGDPGRMASLANAALHHGGWTELIYTGPGNPGYSILGGKVIPNSQLPKSLYQQHETHVHLAR